MNERRCIVPGDQTLRKFSNGEEQRSTWKTIWGPGSIFLLLNTGKQQSTFASIKKKQGEREKLT